MASSSSSNEKPIGDVLHTYFNGGPVSLDLIDTNLYLGNLTAATDIPTLTKYGITHILTIDTVPLPRSILDLKHITTKYIQLCDLPKEDLLSYFEDTQAFIDSAVSTGKILIHCYFGVSRSATITIAYIMQKYKLGYSDAFQKVKNKRSIVYPNQGFVAQLKLYKEMNYKLDKNFVKYKVFRLNLAAEKVRRVKILPHDYIDLVKPDPGLRQINPEPNVYRCRKCRRVLASESNLIVHQDKITGKTCVKTFFIEPIAWMNGVALTTHGKLNCPNCSNKVGSFSWTMGCQCPCGAQVAPAFYLTPSKVDWTNVVKNVEVTI